MMTRSELIKTKDRLMCEYKTLKYSRLQEHRQQSHKLPSIAKEIKKLANALHRIDNVLDYSL